MYSTQKIVVDCDRELKEKLLELCERTHRNQKMMITYLIEKEYERLKREDKQNGK